MAPMTVVGACALALLAGRAPAARVTGQHDFVDIALSEAASGEATNMTAPSALLESNGSAGHASAGEVGSRGSSDCDPSMLQTRSDLLSGLARGGQGEALIPALVPPAGLVYQFKNKESFGFAERNEYKWELDEIEDSGGKECEIDATIAKLKGKWTSNTFGHKSVHVYDKTGEEVFKIRASKNVWNPFSRRWSFRILPPGSKNNSEALFTINKDQFGRGFFWLKEEWRIYRGRERHEDLVYYCVGSFTGWDYKFYHSPEDYERKAKPVATIKQKLNAGAIVENSWLPDKFKLKVGPSEDAALLLAVSTIIDMTHDSKGGSEGVIDESGVIDFGPRYRQTAGAGTEADHPHNLSR